jgi:hypothetical protein
MERQTPSNAQRRSANNSLTNRINVLAEYDFYATKLRQMVSANKTLLSRYQAEVVQGRVYSKPETNSKAIDRHYLHLTVPELLELILELLRVHVDLDYIWVPGKRLFQLLLISYGNGKIL